MSNQIFIKIYGLDLQEGNQEKRAIRQELDHLNLSINLTLVPSDSRDLFFSTKEVHAVIMYQEPLDQNGKKSLRTVMDYVIRHMDIVLIPVSGILSKNRGGIF